VLLELLKIKLVHEWNIVYLFVTSSKFHAFASTAGGLRTYAGALFASFKKYAAYFLNSAFGVTEPNNAPNTGTDQLNQPTKWSFQNAWLVGLLEFNYDN